MWACLLESGALPVLDADGTITWLDDDRGLAYWAYRAYGACRTNATYTGNTIRHRGFDDN